MPEFWSRTERIVASEIAAAAKAGRTINGAKIEAMTGLSREDVCAALRKLGIAGLIRAPDQPVGD